MKVKLIQHVIFHATSKSRRDSRLKILCLSQKDFSINLIHLNYLRNVVEMRYHSEIEPLSVVKWDKGSLIIPAVCPTSNGTCRIIEVSYSIVFTFGASNSIDEHLSIPITIGTIPLRDIEQLNITPSAPVEMPLPPSYEACL